MKQPDRIVRPLLIAAILLAALVFGALVLRLLPVMEPGLASSSALPRSTPRLATPGVASHALARKAASGSGCVSNSNSGYTVRVCISTPGPGSAITGNTTVEATVTVQGRTLGVQHIAFYLNGQPLLESFHAPYRFTLPAQDWVDGSYSLSAEAMLRDHFTTSRARIPLTFQTGTTQAPAPRTQWHPTSGTSTGGPFVMATVGDGAGGEPTETAVINLIASWHPSLLLYLGDVYEHGTIAEFSNWYGPLYGRFRSITDPTVGNHEYLTPGAQGYFNYWGTIPNYYSFDAHGWHFISLNSNVNKVGVDPSSAQYRWLAADLAKDTSKCTAVFFHHPYLSIGKEGGTSALASLWQLMAQHHVTLVLNGHDHEYQRWQPLDGSGQPSPTGMTEFVDGTGGHSITPFVRTDNRLVAQYSNSSKTYGAMRWVLNPDSAAFSFITANGAVIDSGTVSCKG